MNATLEPATDEDDLRKAIEDVRQGAAEAHRRLGSDALPAWVVFGPGTKDHPGLYVARLWRFMPPASRTDVLVRSADLDQLRSLLPANLTLLPRMDGDDPNVLETWI